MRLRLILPALLATLLANSTSGYAQLTYKLPPQAVVDIIDAPRPPVEFPSPDHEWLVVTADDDIRSMAELARPFFKFAGLRVDPQSNSQVQSRFFRDPFLLRLADGVKRTVAMPAGSRLGVPIWSNDSRFVALPRYTDSGVELWTADTQSGKATKLTGPIVNATLIEGYRQIHRALAPLNIRWAPDNRHILVIRTVAGRGAPPKAPPVPSGPIVMDADHNFAQERNWEDLSKTPLDHDLFDYYCTGQMVEIDAVSGEQKPIGAPRLFITPPAVSPDGRYILVQRAKRPYSYWVRYREFGIAIEIWDRQGHVVRVLADLPSTELVSPGTKRPNLTALEWQAHKPATLVWIEDGSGRAAGTKPSEKNRLMRITAPFSSDPDVVAGSRLGFDRFIWLDKEDLALVTEATGTRQWITSKTSLVNFARPADPSRTLFEYADEDSEAHPGNVVERSTAAGERVALQAGQWLFLSGAGGSPTGDRPFLDRVNLDTKETTRLFRSGAGSYETFVAFAGASRTQIVIAHETPDEPRAFRRVNLDTRETTVLTEVPHPYPQLKGITKQLVTYTRNDGLPLSGTLYLPASYRQGDRLPLVIWSYPTEYADARIAGQVRVAADSFTALRGGVLGDNGGEGGASSARLFATQGYAVLFMAEMPVVGDGKKQNETYIPQIVASAKAAIDKLDAMGIIDPKRVGMAGHSYGGFSAANLLANSGLFAAGIARSGSHNRTLDPWGFHAESGTVWEAPELFLTVSPFFSADKITAPLLLIHGEEDDSQASKPIQSYRMFHALRGLGAVARLVLLPRENHAYSARESILHVSAEMIEWFDKYVKNKTDRH